MPIALIVGPSGSGKTTIGKILEKEYGFGQLVSCTTRPKRLLEEEGVDYYFTTEESLLEMELAESTTYNGNMYALSKQEVEQKLNQFENVYFITDKNGAQQISDHYPFEAHYYFLEVTIETMVERMKQRGDTDEQITSRIDHAIDSKELLPPEHIPNFVTLEALDPAFKTAGYINEMNQEPTTAVGYN